MWSPAEGVCSHIIPSFGEKCMLTCIFKCFLCSAKLFVYAEDSHGINTLYHLQHGKR